MTRNSLLRTAALAACALSAACAGAGAPKSAMETAPPMPLGAVMKPIPNPVAREPEVRREPRPALAAAAPPSTPRIAAPAPAPVAKAAPPPQAPTVNPVRAAKLRAAGLEQLNRGAVSKAVALLAEASRLDPASPLIQRDLARAQRIARAVSGRG